MHSPEGLDRVGDVLLRVGRREREREDLAAGPLFRATLLRLDPREHVALYTMHHIVSDGWSMDVFFREMGALYAACAGGRPSPLPPLPLQYADFARRQRRVLAGEHILGKDGVADDLERLREKGLIRHMGITAIGETDSVCEVIRSGRFDSAQVYYNLLNPSAGRSMPKAWTGQNMGGLIEACRAHGVAVMAIRIFAAGVIATDERTGRESVLVSDTSVAEDERKTRAVLEAIGTGHGTRAQVALRFVLANPDVSCAIIGTAELHHIDEALQAAEMGPLPPEVLARLDALYETDFHRA